MTIIARIHYLRLGAKDFAAGLREAERGAKLYPNDPQILSYFALGLGNRGDVEQALVAAERAVDLDPMSREPVQNYLGALARAGRRGDLLRAADEALARFPESLIVGSAVGAWRSRFGDQPGALESRLKALSLAPDDASLRFQIAANLYAFGFQAAAAPFIASEESRLMLMAMNPTHFEELREYVKRYQDDIPVDVQAAIAYATGYEGSLIPALEQVWEERVDADNPQILSVDLLLAYKASGMTDALAKAIEENEKRIALAIAKGANDPEFWNDAALVAAAADNAALVVERLDKALAMRSVARLGAGWLSQDPAFAGVKDDMRVRGLAAKIDAEWNRQRQEIIDSGVLDRVRAAAAK
jgi:tetratricopeptide (TPR) repeat protein